MKTRAFTALLAGFIFCSQSFSNQQSDVSVWINDTKSSQDDYIGWSPVLCKIRADNARRDVRVTLKSGGGVGGAIWFDADNGQWPSPINFNKKTSLVLRLPQDGSWVSFYIAGKTASIDGKDTQLIVEENGQTIHEIPLMVRVRKNAESLTRIERDRFLNALAKVHRLESNTVGSEYMKYIQVHSQAFSGIHSVPGFLPWHRLFVLSLERELQEFDPRVTIPYWKFDKPAPKLFSKEFLGRYNASTGEVEFSQTNPIRDWQIPGSGQISRVANLDTEGANVIPEKDVLDRPRYGVFWFLLEQAHHNSAHNDISGWLATAGSPRDPLFFLLHCNVDRVYAHWQEKHGRTDTGVDSYSIQGKYPGPAVNDRWKIGSYLQDKIWPWSGVGGEVPGDPLASWPNLTISLPSGFPGYGPPKRPAVSDMIDYLGTRGSKNRLGFYYEKLQYR